MPHARRGTDSFNPGAAMLQRFKEFLRSLRAGFSRPLPAQTVALR